MSIGYLLGGMFCLVYMVLLVFLGGVKRNAFILKMTKQKLGKKMSDDNAAKICLIFGLLMGAVGVFLLIYGVMQQ